CLPFFFSSRRRHTGSYGDWSSDVCSSDLAAVSEGFGLRVGRPLLKCEPFGDGGWHVRTDNQLCLGSRYPIRDVQTFGSSERGGKIGRASCRERVKIVVCDETLRATDARGR